MSLKTDIEMVKDELTSEEKFFEKAVVTEKFVKKYKNIMIGSVVAITLFVAGNITYNMSEQNRIEAANVALLELQKDANNKTALSQLESLSPVLADVWSYSNAVANNNIAVLEKLKSSKSEFISDLATYSAAAGDSKKLESYAAQKDAIYADLANIQGAVLLMNENNIDAAHKKLAMITLNSPLSKIAKALMHYGVK